MDLGCSMIFFEVESQGLLMRLGLRGALQWVTRGTHRGAFLTYVSIM